MTPPPPGVLRAFELTGTPVPLTGGQGGAWRVGSVVLKEDTDPRLQEWLGTVLAGVEQAGFVLPEVLRAADGRWVVDGWGASAFVPGTSSETGRVDVSTVLTAGRAFHAATQALPRPAFLAEREDWWARADRAAWGEAPAEVIAPLRPLVAELEALLAPLGPDQLIHADLTGNVLARPGRPPVIIAVPPACRPPASPAGPAAAPPRAALSPDAPLLRSPPAGARPQGRGAGGVAGVKLGAGAHVVSFTAVDVTAPADVVTVAGSSATLPLLQTGSLKVTSLDEFPAKGRSTGGVRCHRFLRGEDVLIGAWVVPHPARACSEAGQPIDLPEPLGRRDGSGTPVAVPIAAVG